MDPQVILQGAQDALTARRVFGEPIRVDDVTVIPAAIIGGGGGGGGSNAKDEGGVGYGMRAKPAGVFVIKQGRVSWRPAVNVNLIVAGGQLVAIAALLMARTLFERWTHGRRGAVSAQAL